MAIITISRGCFSHGKEISEKVAEMLGYECVSREILLEASQFFHVPEMKLAKSIHDAPSLMERITHGREQYLVYIRAALMEHVKKDNVVYHGNAGHLLIPEIPHVLKVRIIADMDDRISLLQQREKLSRDEAVTFIQNEDKHRARWTRYLYNVETNDPSLYDIVIKIGTLNIRDACEMICNKAKSDAFRTTSESEKAVSDLAISSHVKASLQTVCDAEVTSNDGFVHVKVGAQKIRKTDYISPKTQEHFQEQLKSDLARQISDIAHKIPGVREVVCDIGSPYYS